LDVLIGQQPLQAILVDGFSQKQQFIAGPERVGNDIDLLLEFVEIGPRVDEVLVTPDRLLNGIVPDGRQKGSQGFDSRHQFFVENDHVGNLLLLLLLLVVVKWLIQFP
jgi:hypothetical protein